MDMLAFDGATANFDQDYFIEVLDLLSIRLLSSLEELYLKNAFKLLYLFHGR